MHELNKSAMHYGLGRQDFMSLLSRDVDEQESMRVAKEEEQERAMYSVRVKFISQMNNTRIPIVCNREGKHAKREGRLENGNCKLCFKIVA